MNDRCGECRLGLGTHNTADPLCELRNQGKHRGAPRICLHDRCGQPEDMHVALHPFKHPAYSWPMPWEVWT